MYEQDGDESNGPEPIEWAILDENKDGTLLINRYILDYVPYHDTSDNKVTWETCSLREWLNNDFYNTAFDDEMKLKINTVTLANEDNQRDGAPGGNDTSDMIFCLSLSEIIKYYTFDYLSPDAWSHGFSQELITPPTMYAKDRGTGKTIITDELIYYINRCYDCSYSADCVGKMGASWWLRTHGEEVGSACLVVGSGETGENVYYRLSDNRPGVRPALYINK
ncbi:MAG: hypothetical protein IJ691_05485 [Lachnospiraceae bacterium]|nr:hypothetical protein [Lachnospiraceae bacterium]